MEGKTANVDLIQSNGFGFHTRYLLHSLEFGELSESKKIDFPKEKHLVFNQCGRDHFSLHLKFWNPFSIIPGKEFNRDIMAVARKPLPTLRAYWRFCTKTIQVEAGGVLLRIDKLDSLAFGTIKVRRKWIRFRDPHEISRKRSVRTAAQKGIPTIS